MRKYETLSEDDTERLGARLSTELPASAVVMLKGPLGTGKTAFSRGVATGLGVEPGLVHSPTFSLVNEYPTKRGAVYHVDLYRLDGAKAQYGIGLEEILDSESVVLVEWADRLRIPIEAALSVEIRDEGGDRRTFHVKGMNEADNPRGEAS